MKLTYEWESVFGPVVLTVASVEPLPEWAQKRLGGHVSDLNEMVDALAREAMEREEPF